MSALEPLLAQLHSLRQFADRTGAKLAADWLSSELHKLENRPLPLVERLARYDREPSAYAKSNQLARDSELRSMRG